MKKHPEGMTVDEAMTALVDAPSEEAATDLAWMLPMSTLRGLADLLYLDTEGERKALVGRVVPEARA
ncbi:hypothetical protein ACFWDN_13095 [Micromonospora chalcea]